MSENLSYIVFTDFDGTIAVNDIGDAMFNRFGDIDVCTESFEQYRNGEIDARDCWKKGFASIPSVTKDDFVTFAYSQSVDLHFKTFVEFCSEKNISINVLSDGYDAYIDPVLKREGLDWLPRFSNRLQFNDDGTVEPIFPYTDAECKRCANCKRNHLLTKSSDDNVIVYIGDGISDRCPAQFADIVFAKDSLVSFCETHNITFHRFENFSDVLKNFRMMIETKKPRKRRTAELARKDVFMME
ncbi:MAG: MtnX-like HAD-IB family phosphatase [Bacteroidota bacterium]|nr:MtnX-like HAD-IB family phosphatase [Bacteroidota bacterium]